MLALTRKEGERIVLLVPDGEDQVEIVVEGSESRSGTARLGIDAPQKGRIVREELIRTPAGVAR